jgi:hypothetical protein
MIDGQEEEKVLTNGLRRYRNSSVKQRKEGWKEEKEFLTAIIWRKGEGI